MNQLFSSSSTFASLSLHDLMTAREDFHLHLMSKKNVVATALGLYRIRVNDAWPNGDEAPLQERKRKKEKRTLFNSEIRPYSWPCIYVFVSDWEEEERLSATNASDVVPRTIFTKHRAVPVCVIEAKKQDYTKDFSVNSNVTTARNFFGPGSLIINKNAQGMPRAATAGCIVKDGERYYALTNKHAIGEVGTPIYSIKGTSVIEIGKSADKGVTKKLMKDIYPYFNLEQQYLQMDLGLVDLSDVTQWKTEVGGINNTVDVLDLYDTNLTLQLLGKKVVGRAAVSGIVRGEIQGLFYRYKSMGGFEYISDFLIGPDTTSNKKMKEPDDRNISFAIHHGDSGTLLFIENEEPIKNSVEKIKKHYPFALLWGKNEFFEGNETCVQPYGLATALSTAFEVLDIDYVKDLNRDNDYIWGYIGHYAIGSKLSYSVNLLNAPKLKSFIDKNASLLSLDSNHIKGNDPKVLTRNTDGTYDVDHPHFVPLADVPDNVWKGNVNFWIDGDKKRHVGPGARNSFENPNHFADIDLPYKGYKTFSEFVLNDPTKNLTPAAWMDYYNSLSPKLLKWAVAIGKKPEDEKKQAFKHWGALPFRVQQLYNIMVDAALHGKQEEFLTAGGVLIHYIGDACQPLHTSYLSQGDPDDLVEKSSGNGKQMRANGVHGGYEDDMVDYGYTHKSLATEIETEITRQQGVAKEKIISIKKGFDAAKATLILAQACQKTVSPRAIVDKWGELLSIHSKEQRSEQMWDDFGKGTITCMARGCRYLAAIWQSAWEAGKGDQNMGNIKKLKEKDISALYSNPDFAKSNSLKAYDLGE